MVFKKIAFLISVVALVQLTCTAPDLDENQKKFGYSSFPDIVNLDGRLICVFYNGWEHGSYPNDRYKEFKNGGKIMSIESLDSGRTWSTPRVIVDTVWDDRDPSLTIVDEKLILTFFQLFVNDNKFTFQTVITESLDNGKTWAKLRVVKFGFATTSPIVVLNSGRLLMPLYRYYNNRLMDNGGCYIVESDDKGLTWSEPKLVIDSRNATVSEPALVAFRDEVVMVARADEDNKNMQVSLSKNKGKTWNTPSGIGFPGQAPYLFNLDDKFLILGLRNPLTSIRITNNIQSFSPPLVVDYEYGAYGAYPSITQIAPNKLLIAYYVENYPDIVNSELRFRYVIIENDTFEVSDLISRVSLAN